MTDSNAKALLGEFIEKQEAKGNTALSGMNRRQRRKAEKAIDQKINEHKKRKGALPELSDSRLLVLMQALQHLQLANAAAAGIMPEVAGYRAHDWLKEVEAATGRVLGRFTGCFGEEDEEDFLDINQGLSLIVKWYLEAGDDNQTKMLALIRAFREGQVYEVPDDEAPAVVPPSADTQDAQA